MPEEAPIHFSPVSVAKRDDVAKAHRVFDRGRQLGTKHAEC